MSAIKMRIPTTKEWDHMIDVVNENNDIAHWENILSWVHDQDSEQAYPPRHMHRGYYSARSLDYYAASTREAYLGFRPVFEGLTPNALVPYQNGVTVIGTLYMNGEPVRVPHNPTEDGDIKDYIPGATLTFGPALGVDYAVTAIKVGDIYMADRVLLKNISYEDIEKALSQKPDVPMVTPAQSANQNSLNEPNETQRGFDAIQIALLDHERRFEAVLVQHSPDDGITQNEINRMLFDMKLSDYEQVMPVTIESDNAWAFGFILDKVDDEMLNFDHNVFAAAVREVLNDTGKERADGRYVFAGIYTKLTY